MPVVKAKTSSTVMVLSDSTGNLARHMLAAVLTQFPAKSISARFENFVRTESRLNELLAVARKQKLAVCHAMVSDHLKTQIKAACKAARLRCFDLTGDLVDFLEKSTTMKPTTDLDALHRLDEAYRRRISAMEFTLSHDDGLGLETIEEADVVLVGVSRTSKTPTSILLAQQGYWTANVSLARAVQPPSVLFRLPARKVVGLTISADQLAMIRARRQAAWGMLQTSYGHPQNVTDEVAWSRSLFREHGWPILDVTDQAVEETAAKVAEIVGPAGEQDSLLAEILPN